MIYLKLIVPILTLIVAIFYVALQEKWWKIHDDRRARHKWFMSVLVFLFVLSAIANCVILCVDEHNANIMLSKIDKCMPPKRMGALKPKFLSLQSNETASVSINTRSSVRSIRIDDTRNTQSQTMQIDIQEGQLVQPISREIAFSLRRTSEGLLISAVVHDFEGKIVARILDNHWEVYNERLVSRNFDSSSLEIIDSYGVPILQVEYLTPNTIKVGGVFRAEKDNISQIDRHFPCLPDGSRAISLWHFSDGGIVLLGDRGRSSKNSWPTTVIERDDLVRTAKKLITPWFDYSDPDRLGVRFSEPRKMTR